MKKTATATPDGHGGFNIVFNDPKKGFIEALVNLLVSLSFAFITGGFTYLGQWVIQNALEKKEEDKDKAA